MEDRLPAQRVWIARHGGCRGEEEVCHGCIPLAFTAEMIEVLNVSNGTTNTLVMMQIYDIYIQFSSCMVGFWEHVLVLSVMHQYIFFYQG